MDNKNQSLAEQILEKASPRVPARVGLSSTEIAEIKKAAENEVRVYVNQIGEDEDLSEFEFDAGAKLTIVSSLKPVFQTSTLKQKTVEKIVTSELKTWEQFIRRANYLKLLKDNRMSRNT